MKIKSRLLVLKIDKSLNIIYHGRGNSFAPTFFDGKREL